MQAHYVYVKVRKSALAQKEKDRLIRNGDGFALVGEMTLETTENDVIDGTFDAMFDIVAEEIAREMEIYAAEAERQRRERALDDALDAAFSSDEDKEDMVEVKEVKVNEENGEEEVVIVKRKKEKEKPMSALDLAIQRRKQVELVERGLADPTTLRRALNDQDISSAAEKIEDNIVENALDGVIEEVEMYLNSAFEIDEVHRGPIMGVCLRLWMNDETLTEVILDSKLKPEREEGEEGEGGERGDDEEEDEEDEEDLHLDDFDIGFGDAGAIAIADAMRDNTIVKSLVIRNQAIGDDGCTAIADILGRNDTITNLDLSMNHICNVGATEVAKMMCVNDKLTR